MGVSLAGAEEPAWRRASHSISASRRCGGTQTAPDGRTGRVPRGADEPASSWRTGWVCARPRGCGGPPERPMSLRRRTLRPEESRSRKSPVSGGKGGAFSERPVSWGAARGRLKQAFFGGGSGLFYGAARKAAPPFAAEGAARDGSRRDCGAASRRGRCRTSRSDASSRLLNAAFGKVPSGAGVSVKGRLVAKPG